MVFILAPRLVKSSIEACGSSARRAVMSLKDGTYHHTPNSVPTMKAGDNDCKIVVPRTHRGHLRRVSGGRCRISSVVHDDLESLSTLGGIRNRERFRMADAVMS